MTLLTQASVLAAFVSVGLLPLLTGHALLHETPHVHADGLARALEHPDFVILLALTVAATAPLARMGGSLRRWLAASRRLRAITADGSPRRFRGIDYERVPGNEIAFFTAGFRHPTIYVSSGAESLLGPGAFHAALLHERAHAEQRDVRWLVLIAALEGALGFVPWSRQTFATLQLLVERHADERALAAGASRFDLFEAIVLASNAPPSGAAGLSAAGTLQRLRWLAEPAAGQPDGTRIAAALFTTLMAPPAVAHLVLWGGLLCAVCSTHFL